MDCFHHGTGAAWHVVACVARAAGVVFAIVAASIGFTAFAQKASPDRATTQANGKKEAKPDRAPARVQPESVIAEALRAADQIAIPWMKAYALADIAAIQAKLRQAEPARATFRRAAEIIEGNRDNESLYRTQLAWLAKAQAVGGDRAGARETIARIIALAQRADNARDRRPALDVAARWQIDGGNPEGALSLVEARKDAPASWRAYMLSGIGGTQSAAGDLVSARATMTRALPMPTAPRGNRAPTITMRCVSSTPCDSRRCGVWRHLPGLRQERGTPAGLEPLSPRHGLSPIACAWSGGRLRWPRSRWPIVSPVMQRPLGRH